MATPAPQPQPQPRPQAPAPHQPSQAPAPPQPPPRPAQPQPPQQPAQPQPAQPQPAQPQPAQPQPQSQPTPAPPEDLDRLPADWLAPPREMPYPDPYREGLPEKSDDRIHVGNPQEAAERQGQIRPVRSIHPALQPPPPRTGKELRKGETYWIVNPEDLGQPRQGKIIRLTRTPGKHVGVEFQEPVGPHIVHDCDGAGQLGHCLYCRVDQVLTNDEYKLYGERRKAILAAERPLEDLDVLRLDVTAEGRPTVR